MHANLFVNISKNDHFNSYRFLFGIDFRGYFGFLGGLNVLGLWKWTDVLIFRTLEPCTPFKTYEI